MYLSLCFANTSIAKDSIVGILYLVQSYYVLVLLTRTMILHLHDLVTCCTALMQSHREGPEYHIHHADEQIRLLVYTLNLLLWKPKRHLFGHPAMV
jgi:hypothetical protein